MLNPDVHLLPATGYQPSGKQNTCSHLGCSHASPAASLEQLMQLKPRVVGGVARGAASGAGSQRDGGVSGEGQPRGRRGSLSKCLLIATARTGGGAGAGSWCFINRVIVANGAKVLTTVLPAYGQVSWYNLPVLGLRTLDGIFSAAKRTSVPDSC